MSALRILILLTLGALLLSCGRIAPGGLLRPRPTASINAVPALTSLPPLPARAVGAAVAPWPTPLSLELRYPGSELVESSGPGSNPLTVRMAAPDSVPGARAYYRQVLEKLQLNPVTRDATNGVVFTWRLPSEDGRVLVQADPKTGQLDILISVNRSSSR